MEGEGSKKRSGRYQFLLLGLLGHIRRVDETPLLFEINSRGIALSSFQLFLQESKELNIEVSRNSREVINAIENAMDLSLGKALVPHDDLPSGTIDLDVVTDLAKWLECLFQNLRVIDPKAIEILGLRVEGLDNRSISKKLDTGLRLINRIVEDIACSPVRFRGEGEESC